MEEINRMICAGFKDGGRALDEGRSQVVGKVVGSACIIATACAELIFQASSPIQSFLRSMGVYF